MGACEPVRPGEGGSGSRCWSARAANCGQRDSAQSVGVFCDGGARPPVQTMIAFIDNHRAAYGVEPICRVLPIAPSTYHADTAKRADPTKLSARAQRDAALQTDIKRVWDTNFQV